jgi:protease-4
VVVVDGLCASGGYIAALASDHIIAQSASLVGSIGVLIQYPNFTDLLKTVGVKVEDVKSSPLKAAPNGFEPTSPEARAALASIVMDSYDWFRDLVGKRRSLEGEPLAKVADGRVFTGRQALDMKLIDELGNEQTAIAWLAKEKGIDPKTPVRNYSLSSRLSDFSFLHLTAVSILNAVGLDGFARSLEQSGAFAAVERLNLDGLLALWHPSPVN